MCCCINSVNAERAAMISRWVPVEYLGLRGDLRHGGSSRASTDLGYGGSSTAATSTHSTSNLVERYQKMSMPPRAEGKLRYSMLELTTKDC